MKKKSFSLIEIMFSVTIFVVAASLTIATAANTLNTKYKTKNISSVQKNAQNIVQSLSNLVFQANGCEQYIWPEIGPIYFYGITVDPNYPGYVYHSPGSSGYPHPAGTNEGKRLLGVYIDQYNNIIKKSIYVDNGYLVSSEVINPGTGSVTHTRNLSDNDVKINSLTFYTANIYEITNYCQSQAGFKPPYQNFLKIDMEIESRNTDPKGKYVLHYTKYISAKNFNYKTRYQ